MILHSSESLSAVNLRDRLFDLLNDSEGTGIADLNADERNSLLTVRTEDGNVFEMRCLQGQLFITKNEPSAEHKK